MVKSSVSGPRGSAHGRKEGGTVPAATLYASNRGTEPKSLNDSWTESHRILDPGSSRCGQLLGPAEPTTEQGVLEHVSNGAGDGLLPNNPAFVERRERLLHGSGRHLMPP